MKKYRYLVATDMDYTFIAPGGEIPRKNLEAVRALRENGVAFTIATGRTFFLVGKYADELGIDVPLITSNGACLWDSQNLTTVYSNPFEPAKARELASVFFEGEMDFTGYGKDAIWISDNSTRNDFFDKYNEGLPDRRKAVLKRFSKDLLCEEKMPQLDKFLLINASSDIETRLKSDKDLEVVASAKDFLDVMNAGSSKGTGLLRLADYLGIDHSHVCALGDSENDIAMIKAAGKGIAMGNATDDVKQCADYISKTFNEDGFAHAVYDFILPYFDSLAEA